MQRPKSLIISLPIVDNNNLQIDGSVEEVNCPYPIPEKFVAFGWNVIEIDGHSFDDMEAALQAAHTCKERISPLPSLRKLSRARAFPSWKISAHGTVLRRMRSSMSWR